MSEQIKYGETYASIAENVLPLIDTVETSEDTNGIIKYSDTYNNIATKVKGLLQETPINPDITAKTADLGQIKYFDTYRTLADKLKPYIAQYPINMSVYPSTSYPPWWNVTITLYNHYVDKTTQLTTWYRTVLKNCFFQNQYEVTVGGETIGRTNSTIVRIPQNYIYKDYADWYTGEKTSLDKYFTLRQGDIIIRGEVDDIIDETKKGMYSTDIVAKYKDLGLCTQIEAYQNNTGGGRGTPHYKVIGD